MRDHMRAELIIAALTMAIQWRRPGPGLIRWDNAPTESFFRMLKTELVRYREYPRSGCRPARPVRLYRGLLQSSADPLCHRIHHPRSSRGEVRVTRCPLFRGKAMERDILENTARPYILPHGVLDTIEHPFRNVLGVRRGQ
jgi:transposase InsO family protein